MCCCFVLKWMWNRIELKMKCCIVEIILNVLKRIFHFELMALIVVITILTILYASPGYLRAVILCFRLKGPPARLFLGNVLILIDDNSKLKLKFNPEKCFFFKNLHFHFHFIAFLLFFSVLEKYFALAEKMYGRVFRLWAIIFPVFVVTHPDDLKTVLSSRKNTEKLYKFYQLMQSFVGNGLITSSSKRKYLLIHYTVLEFSTQF